MIEISQIIFHLLLLIFLTSFPINKYLFSENNIIKDLNFIVAISINTLFLMFLLLFFSFLKIQLESIFYLILIIYICLLSKILIFRKKKNCYKKLASDFIFFIFIILYFFEY